MASLIDLNRKIAKLQKQADAIKNRERKGIIAQIRQAIVDYELTPDDLFSANGAVIRRGRRPAGGRLGAASEEGSARPRRGRPVPIRYRDDEGNTWTGRGKQPNWLRAHVEAGHDIEEFRVNEES